MSEVKGKLGKLLIDPTDRKKIVLSVDGGGMRGAIPIAMLAYLEEETGLRCNELFDMVAGTSTGAIIAVGLAIGYSAKELMQEVYCDHLPAAFRGTEKSWFTRLAAKILNTAILHLGEDFVAGLLASRFHYAYPMEPFQEELFPILKEKGIFTMGQLPAKPIVLVTTKDVTTGDTYFVVNTGRGNEGFENWPLTGAVAASGAAPIFFPPVISRLVDGGVGVYSNPCLAAAVQAVEYNDFKMEDTILISLGTGYVGNVVSEQEAKKASVLHWGRYVILESLDDSALQQVFVTRSIYGVPPHLQKKPEGRMDFRRYNPHLDRTALESELGMDLSCRPDPSQLGLDSFQPPDIQLMLDIGKTYAQRINWSEPYVMPWDTMGGHHKPNPEKVFTDQMVKNPINWDDSEYAVKKNGASER